jgi:cell division protein FtsB
VEKRARQDSELASLEARKDRLFQELKELRDEAKDNMNG